MSEFSVNSTDARDWAKEAVAMGVNADEEWMVAWFANAIEAGRAECGVLRDHIGTLIAMIESRPARRGDTMNPRWTALQLRAMLAGRAPMDPEPLSNRNEQEKP